MPPTENVQIEFDIAALFDALDSQRLEQNLT
jgi:hypothetical protein